jgi:hypothetical protein
MVAGSRPDEVIYFSSIYLILPAALAVGFTRIRENVFDE